MELSLFLATCHIAMKPWVPNRTRVIIAFIVAINFDIILPFCVRAWETKIKLFRKHDAHYGKLFVCRLFFCHWFAFCIRSSKQFNYRIFMTRFKFSALFSAWDCGGVKRMNNTLWFASINKYYINLFLFDWLLWIWMGMRCCPIANIKWVMRVLPQKSALKFSNRG